MMNDLTSTGAIRIVFEEQELLDAAVSQYKLAAEAFCSALPDTPHILLVEDDPTIVAVMERTIGTLGNVLWAKDGKEAVEFLRRYAIDIIFADSVGLPAVPLLQEMAPDTRIVVVSGKPAPEVLPEGVYRWIRKPFDYKEIRQIVQDHIDLEYEKE